MITSSTSTETYYLNGVQSNFAYYAAMVPAAYGITVTPPATYYTQPAVAYVGTSTEKLGKIALQKWVSLFFTGLEGWFDWRRTGLPIIVPGLAFLDVTTFKSTIQRILPVTILTTASLPVVIFCALVGFCYGCGSGGFWS